MISDLDAAKYRYELERLQSFLVEDLGFQCQIFDANTEVPVDSLAVLLAPDWNDHPRAANLMFLEMEGAGVDSLKLLQFYSELPTAVSPEQEDTILRFLTAANGVAPVGCFVLTAEKGLIYKYINAFGKFTAIEQDEFIQLFLLWMYTLDSVSVLIDAVVDGLKSLEDALAELAG